MEPRSYRHTRHVFALVLILFLLLGAAACATPPPTATPTPIPTATRAPTLTPAPTATPTPTVPPEPAPAGFQKGMSYAAWWNGAYSSAESDQALAELAATGSEWISLIVTCYQETVDAAEITCDLPRTPTDDDLIHVFHRARELELKVMLKPHLDLNNDDAHWRGDIGTAYTTEDEWAAWFAAYQTMIVRYAELAEAQQAEQVCVATELSGTIRREAEWRAVIDAVREAYSGPLVYASNHGVESSIAWWDALDYIGVDAYYPLTSSIDPTLDELKAAWRVRVNPLQRLSQRVERPVVITEIGYRSIEGANVAPWEYATTRAVDLEEQDLCYRAALESLWGQPWLAGIYWWNWETDPERGGAGDDGFTPHEKPAEETLRVYYGTQTIHLPVIENP